MRAEDKHQHEDAPLTEIGSACGLTHGTFMPHAAEQVLIKDYFDEP